MTINNSSVASIKDLLSVTLHDMSDAEKQEVVTNLGLAKIAGEEEENSLQTIEELQSALRGMSDADKQAVMDNLDLAEAAKIETIKDLLSVLRDMSDAEKQAVVTNLGLAKIANEEEKNSVATTEELQSTLLSFLGHHPIFATIPKSGMQTATNAIKEAGDDQILGEALNDLELKEAQDEQLLDEAYRAMTSPSSSPR